MFRAEILAGLEKGSNAIQEANIGIELDRASPDIVRLY